VNLPQFSSLSLWANLAIFGGAAVFVWAAGTRLANYADALVARTRMSQAFAGDALVEQTGLGRICKEMELRRLSEGE
jgi:hypothetical protein